VLALSSGDALQLTPLDLDDPEFRQRLVDYWTELGGHPEMEWTEHYIARCRQLQDSGCRWSFWGLSEQRRVGFVLLRLETDWLFPTRSIGYIAEFTVFSDYRRHGFGGAQYRCAADYLAAQGCTQIALDVLPTNGVGMLFWRKQGFDLVYHRMRQFV